MLKIQHVLDIQHWRVRLFQPGWPILLLLIVLMLSGCVRRQGRNSDCQWPGALEPKAIAVNQRDLRADLELAEELAIRYMDAHHGPHNPEAAAQAKNRCMGVLLGEIGKEHQITAHEAFQSFGQRSAFVDLAMNLPFILVYALAADFLIRRLLRRYPPSDSWMTSILMITLASVACAAAGLMLGQQWSSLAESIRIGTHHLSNRTFRLPVIQHSSEAFLFGLALFLSIAVLHFRSKRTPNSPRSRV